ncbi:alpha/beta hydrolase [Helicobacter jaachi]|uniref:Alpha/beta hydrolase n=1 Tax=Helicobacter jaachi TaxID=1677920 RepID=A0A4U8TAV4_9HELI|nr:alpha/beta hydrolase [Helicobacter jaachi]TLD96975.1 alpha/beta hydrolase [Helicobacter jaachi]
MAQRRIEYQSHFFDISYEKLFADSMRGATHTESSHIESSAAQGTLDSIADAKSVQSIVFLHGWGSNKDIMKMAFGQCFRDYEHIYVDMPGFGNSPNDTILRTQDYAQIIKDFLRAINSPAIKDCIFVGHSFGGKVALLCEPKELILLSSAGIRVPKSLKVRCKIALAKICNKLGLSAFGKIFRSSDVSAMNEAMYATFKNVVDEDFSSFFSAYEGRASIFWGKDDSATPLASGKQIANLIKNSRFFAMEGGHYFFLEQGKQIENLYRGVA